MKTTMHWKPLRYCARSLFALLLILALLPVCVSCSEAESLAAAGAGESPCAILTFQQDVPGEIRQLLDSHGYARAQVLCGGAVLPDRTGDLSPDWDLAVLIAELDGRRQFIGLQWLDSAGDFVLNVYDIQGLDLDQVTAVEPTVKGVELFRRLFGLRMEDGGLYQVYAGFGTSWRLFRYVSPAGEEIGLLGGELSFGGERRYVVAGNRLDDPRTFAEFPTSCEAAARWAEASWAGVLADGRALIWGANLRQQPTGTSQSLGKYVVAMGEMLDQQPGKQYPWIQVRIGETVGWVSGLYVATPEDRQRFAAHCSGAAYAAASGAAVLFRQPDAAAASVALPEGTFMQVLAETEDGWLHVLVTGDSPDLRPEAAGAYGYVRAEAVERASAHGN